jgi:hypothetical protein
MIRQSVFQTFTLSILACLALCCTPRASLAKDDSPLEIEQISPTLAKVGEKVRLRGEGFNARGLRLLVGDIPTPVMAIDAAGHGLSFTVPQGASLGPTSVTVSAPGRGRSRIALNVSDLTMPDAWRGQWQIKFTYHDAATQAIQMVQTITGFITDDEPLGVEPITAGLGKCRGSVSDKRLDVRCTGQTIKGACFARTTVSLVANLSGDFIASDPQETNNVTTVLQGLCGQFAGFRGSQDIEISGQRLGPDSNVSVPPGSLFASFVPFSQAIASLTGPRKPRANDERGEK